MGEICVLLMFLELVEVFVDEERFDEGKEGRKKAAIYAQELPCALPPFQLACAPTHGRDGQVEF